MHLGTEKPTTEIMQIVDSESSTLLDVINQELVEIEQKQMEHYQRLPHGDYVIYDSRAKIMAFKNKSIASNELFIYQDLDFQEFKK